MILIVDDLPANLNVLQAVLEAKGHRIFAVTGGREAVNLAEKIKPDVVILDVMMPDLNGFETCRLWRENPTLAPIPVIFITARDDDEAMTQGYEAGGVDFITKPFHEHEVQLRIECHLRISQLSRAMAHKNQELQVRQQQLEEALANVKTLKGLLPICAHCKKIRDDQGYWQQVEGYIQEHAAVSFSHGICPECMRAHYAELCDADEMPPRITN